MVFTDIRLQNFRSYADSSFELGRNVTIVVGPNAAGKTNLLEAMMLAAIGKTYRAKENLIRSGSEWARVDVHTDKNELRTVKILAQNGIQKPLYDSPKPVVLFEPNHLFLTQGEPQLRRNYVDDLAEQLHAGFSKARADFRRALAQRNRLLKQGAPDKTVLFALNVRLIESATHIVEKRLDLIAELNKKISEAYSSVAAKKSKLSVEYVCPLDESTYPASLLKNLEQELDIDIARGFTSHGPHRDDLRFCLGGDDMGASASRGETRTLVLALKSIELGMIEKSTGQRPLLLLDDVFSELDGLRRKSLVSFLKSHQTIITTTDADIITKNFSQNCQTIALG